MKTERIIGLLIFVIIVLILFNFWLMRKNSILKSAHNIAFFYNKLITSEEMGNGYFLFDSPHGRWVVANGDHIKGDIDDYKNGAIEINLIR